MSLNIFFSDVEAHVKLIQGKRESVCVLCDCFPRFMFGGQSLPFVSVSVSSSGSPPRSSVHIVSILRIYSCLYCNSQLHERHSNLSNT